VIAQNNEVLIAQSLLIDQLGDDEDETMSKNSSIEVARASSSDGRRIGVTAVAVGRRRPHATALGAGR
jgi:hypothetical protein